MFRARKMTGHTRALAAVLLGLMLAPSRVARADTKACVAAHADGQRAQKAGRLVEAGELFAHCGAMQDCPGPIRAECADFYAAVEQSIPTVLFGVSDADGADITDVKVFIDEQLASDGLDGRSIAIDPGNRSFRFVLPGGETVTRKVLIRQGEKNRLLSLALAPQPASSGGAEPNAEHDASSRALPASFWLAAGVGAAALTSGAVFAALGRGNESEVDACSPSCGPERRDAFDAMQAQYVIADVSFAIAAVSAGVAAWLFLSHDARTPRGSQSARGFQVRPLASTQGGGLLLTATGL